MNEERVKTWRRGRGGGREEDRDLGPVVGAVGEAVDALADLSAVGEVLATDVAEEMVKMPLPAEGVRGR